MLTAVIKYDSYHASNGCPEVVRQGPPFNKRDHLQMISFAQNHQTRYQARTN